MKGIKIIPLFLLLIASTYVGMLFVEANREEVTIQFGNWQSNPTAIGFVVLTSVLVGMMISGLLCSIELFALYVQIKRLKRKIPKPTAPGTAVAPAPAQDVVARPSGKFT